MDWEYCFAIEILNYYCGSCSVGLAIPLRALCWILIFCGSPTVGLPFDLCNKKCSTRCVHVSLHNTCVDRMLVLCQLLIHSLPIRLYMWLRFNGYLSLQSHLVC